MTVTSCFGLAAHALVLLARRGDERFHRRERKHLSGQGATRPRPLARAGLVVGREGGGGGFVPGRPCKEMTRGDVFAALEEGPIFPLHPRLPNARCPVGAGVTPALEELEKEVAEAVRAALAEPSMAWLASRVKVGAAEG